MRHVSQALGIHGADVEDFWVLTKRELQEVIDPGGTAHTYRFSFVKGCDDPFINQDFGRLCIHFGHV